VAVGCCGEEEASARTLYMRRRTKQFEVIDARRGDIFSGQLANDGRPVVVVDTEHDIFSVIDLEVVRKHCLRSRQPSAG